MEEEEKLQIAEPEEVDDQDFQKGSPRPYSKNETENRGSVSPKKVSKVESQELLLVGLQGAISQDSKTGETLGLGGRLEVQQEKPKGKRLEDSHNQEGDFGNGTTCTSVPSVKNKCGKSSSPVPDETDPPEERTQRCDLHEHGCRLSSEYICKSKPHSGDKPYKYNQCGKAFRRSSNLIQHQKIHSGEKPYKCNECGKTFGQNSHLTEHQRIHPGVKPYQCNECGKAFRQIGTFINHQRIHSGEKPYECNVCGKVFRVRSDLIRHQRIHSGERRNECNEYEKTSKNSCLIQHKRTHGGEKLYECNEYGKNFSRSSNLIQHQRIHSGEKSYECSECGKAFSRSSNLIQHQMIHTRV